MDGTNKRKGNALLALGAIIVVAAIVVIGLVARKQGMVADQYDQAGSPEAAASGITDTAPGDVPATATPSSTKTPMNYTQATLHTNLGDIVIALDTASTPNTVANFTKLSSSGFYNGTKFHRVIPDFMIQGGDPLSKDDSQEDRWGTGGPGYQFNDEIKSTNSNAKGTISMANAGPNTNGSQFFINVADNSFLNGKHTVFGRVTSGYEIVEKISKVKTAPGDRPLEAVVIESVELK